MSCLPTLGEIECVLYQCPVTSCRWFGTCFHGARPHAKVSECHSLTLAASQCKPCQPCGFRTKWKCSDCAHFSRCTQTLSLCNGQEEWEPRI